MMGFPAKLYVSGHIKTYDPIDYNIMIRAVFRFVERGARAWPTGKEKLRELGSGPLGPLKIALIMITYLSYQIRRKNC